MIALQSEDWSLLRHAYGSAEGIPSLLEQVAQFPAEPDWRAEPWFSLWGALYHQGDIYNASISAVPAIVSALAQDPAKATLSFYLLPASIAVADHAEPIEVSAEARQRFSAALSSLGSIAAEALPSISDVNIQVAAKAALLASRGDFSAAEELLDADA